MPVTTSEARRWTKWTPQRLARLRQADVLGPNERVDVCEGEIVAHRTDEREPPVLRQWNVAEYHQLGACGVLSREDHVELIDGALIEKMVVHPPHVTSVQLCADALRNVFGAGYVVRQEALLTIPNVSAPEPDLAVVKGSPRDFSQNHPQTAVLVIEVADTTLTYDRTDKANLYASAGVADYWVVNLVDRQLETFRAPVADASATFGYRYSDQQIVVSTGSIAPLAAPNGLIIVDDLMP